MAKKEAFLQFLKAARSLQDRGLSKEAIVQFAKNEFGELSELFKKQIDSLFKPKKGIENIKIKDPDFDDTIIKLPVDDTGVPFNPNDPLKQYGKPKKSRMLDEDEIAELDMDIGGLEYTNDFDGTVESANKLRKERADYIADMELEYKKGNLDPKPGEANRERFLQNKYNEMEASGDNRLMTRDEVEELSSFDLQTDMDKAVEKFKKKDAKQKKIIKDFDPGDRDPSAKGGRAGFYTGGITDVEPSLDDIGHGADALNARTRLMSPGAQATTSTGLNYLLAEDNDNMRIPFSKGKIAKEVADKGRRGFMKAAGATTAGIAALKTGLLGFGKEAAPVVEKAAETVSNTMGEAPAYFLNLIKKIKNLGSEYSPKYSGGREKITNYKDYTLTEHLTTGETTIQRFKQSEVDYYDEMLMEENYMNYRPGMADETTKGKTPPGEYTEDTGYLRTSGPSKGDVIIEGEPIPKDIIEEGTMFEDNMTEFGKTKKASGGIARMIGE